MPKFEVKFYEDEKGKQPAKDFLLSLEIKSRAKMMSAIALLQDNGNELREPYSKALSNGIFELRTKVATNCIRVLYFFYIDKTIILTNGFVKKTNKTPSFEIRKAIKYREDLINRKGKQNGPKIR